MSGHSKWSTIKRQKEANDAKRGQLFSKIARAITLAAKQGGANPDSNIRLRAIIEKAKQVNMPKDNIERAIERGSAADNLQEIVYEGYGPDGVPIIVETATDNKNRTAQEVKNIFTKGGGSLGGPGSVSFQFEKVGQILVKKGQDPQNTMLELIDLGVEDIEEAEDGIQIYTKPEDLFDTKKRIEEKGLEAVEAELAFRPKNPVKIEDDTKSQKILKLLDNLDDYDDVQKVYAGVDF